MVGGWGEGEGSAKFVERFVSSTFSVRVLTNSLEELTNGSQIR